MKWRSVTSWAVLIWLSAACGIGQETKILILGTRQLVSIESLKDSQGRPVEPWFEGTAEEIAEQASINTEAIQLAVSRLGANPANDGIANGLWVPGKGYAINDTIIDGSATHYGYGALIMYGTGGKATYVPGEGTGNFSLPASGHPLQAVSHFVWLGPTGDSGGAISGSAPPSSNVITVTGHTVKIGDLGNSVTITGGDNFIPATYGIVGVNIAANTFTLNANCTTGAGNGTGLEAKLGPVPMFRLRGYGNVINGIHFRGWYSAGSGGVHPTSVGDMLWAAIKVTKPLGSGNPSGKYDFDGCSFVHCQRCYQFEREVGALGNMDNIHYGFNTAHTCPTVVEINDNQSLGHTFTNLQVFGAAFEPYKVIDAKVGGKVNILSLKMVARGTVFATDAVSSGDGDFAVQRLWWDEAALATSSPPYPTADVIFEGTTVTGSTTGKSNTVSIAGYTVEQGDIGKLLAITGGTSFKRDTYQVVAVDITGGNNKLRLNEECTTASGSGMTGALFSGDPSVHAIFDGTTLTGSTTGVSNTVAIAGYTVGDRDVGKTLTVVKGDNFLAGSYVVTAADPEDNELTLDADCTNGVGSAMNGTLTIAAPCRFVDMAQARTAHFELSGHMSNGGLSLPNMMRLKASGGAATTARIDFKQAHLAMARAYPMHVPFRSPNKFVVPPSCRLFVDVEERVDAGDVDWTVDFDGSTIYGSTTGSAATATVTISGYTVSTAADQGKILTITGGTNFLKGSYTVVSVSGSTITLDRNCTNGIGAGSAMTGYLAERTHEPIDTTLESIGDASAANNDLTKFGDTSRPDIVGWLLHNKPAIRFSGGDGLRTLVFDGADVTASADADSATIEITGFTVQPSDVGKTLIITGGEYFNSGTYTVESVDPAANTWTLDANCTGNDPAALMEGRVDHGLASISNLSVGGVIRIDVPVSGEDTIAGVWDENGERCWRVYLDADHQLNLQISTNGTNTFNFPLTQRSIDLNRNTFWYVTRDGSTGDVQLFLDDTSQTFLAGETGTLHPSTSPLTLGCSINSVGAIDDGFVGIVGMLMIDSSELTLAEIEYRAEEFAARRGSWLNPNIAP